MKIARSGQPLLPPFQQLLDSPLFWTPKYGVFAFGWVEPEPEPKPELEIGLLNCKLDPLLLLLFGFKASRKFPNCGSVDANSELNGPVVTSKDGIAGIPKGSGFGFVDEEDETEEVNGVVAEDKVVDELFLLDDEDRLVLLREPPPTGMLRRVPPLVQYLRQLLQ